MSGERRLRGLVLLLACFGAGVVVGVSGDRLLHPPSRMNAKLSTKMPAVLDKLDLTSAQRHAADSILEQSAPRADAVMHEMIPRLGAIADSLNVELHQILTPAQRAKLDSLSGGSLLMLKRKTTGPSGVRVDTVYRR